MMESKKAADFLAVSELPMKECGECRWYPVCRGGFRRDREPVSGMLPAENYFCPAFEEFFDYAMPRLREVAGRIANGHRYF